jgi:hypothetical protein
VRAIAAILPGLLILAAVPAAHADGAGDAGAASGGQPLRRLLVDSAVGVRGGAGWLVDVRGFAGVAAWRGPPRLGHRGDRSPFVALGLHGAAGSVTVADPRAVDGSIATTRTAWGPELRLGLGWMDRGLDLYLYAGGGPVRVRADAITDQLPERGQHLGARAAVGVALPGSYRRALEDDTRCDLGSSSSLCALGPIFHLFLPNTLELTWEHVAGVDRAGFGIGYAF